MEAKLRKKQIRKEIHEEEIRKIWLRSQGLVNKEEAKGLDFSKKRIVASRKNEISHEDNQEPV